MFFGKKEKKDELPDLPSGRAPFGIGSMTPPDDDDDEEGGSHSLPSFPDSPAHNRFSQAIIKDAVGKGKEGESSEAGGDSLLEMEEWKPSAIHQDDSLDDVHEEVGASIVGSPGKDSYEKSLSSRKEISAPDVFVKIDKFHSARRALGEMKDKLGEIENMVKKIREIRLREEQEFSSWEKEVAHIQARVKDVTENIFDKVD